MLYNALGRVEASAVYSARVSIYINCCKTSTDSSPEIHNSQMTRSAPERKKKGHIRAALATLSSRLCSKSRVY